MENGVSIFLIYFNLRKNIYNTFINNMMYYNTIRCIIKVYINRWYSEHEFTLLFKCSVVSPLT